MRIKFWKDEDEMLVNKSILIEMVEILNGFVRLYRIRYDLVKGLVSLKIWRCIYSTEWKGCNGILGDNFGIIIYVCYFSFWDYEYI